MKEDKKQVEMQAAADLAVQNTASAIEQAVIENGEIFRAIGRIETSAFFAKIGNISAAQFADEVRKSKKYKGLPYNDVDGKRKYISTFDEFCDHFLGRTGRTVRELMNNLNLLGSDLYESAEKIGFRTKDYRALKALPAEEQEVVKQALKSENKDEVLGILEDMAARHVAEKEAAKKEKDGLRADLAARDKLLGERSAKLEKTEKELYRLKSLPPNEQAELKLAREEQVVQTINSAHIQLLRETKRFCTAIATVLENEEISLHTKEYASAVFQKICQEMADFVAQHGISVDFEQIISPQWLREMAEAELNN